jgi:type V secretory pathway adhesin AidA
VKGRISTVNGAIKAINTTITEGLSTVNGDIRLLEGSTVNGSVKFTGKSGGKIRDLKLTLSGGSVIKGDVILENSKVRLTIFLLDDSRIEGSIPEGIEPKRSQE